MLLFWPFNIFIVVNNIRNEGTEALAEALKMNTTLTELNINLNQNGYYNGNGRYYDRNNNDITELLGMLYDPVSRNRINYEFSKNPSLTELSLGHRNMHSGLFGGNNGNNNIMIGCESAKVLAEKIKVSTSLANLYIDNNKNAALTNLFIFHR